MALLLAVFSVNVLAVSIESIISEIKAKAENDKYRFMLVDKQGITPELKENIAVNDGMYLSEQPTRSVKIKVLDAYTGKPVKDAQCLFSFSTRSSGICLLMALPPLVMLLW